MISGNDLVRIRKALIDCSQSFNSADLFPTVIPEAAAFVVSDPYAFAIATCLNRRTLAEIIWTIPYDIYQHLGHLDPQRIYTMSLEELVDLFDCLPRRLRYVNDAPRTLKDLTRIVVEECGGDASNIWKGKRASEVKRTFDSVYGVGEWIANMALLLIEKAFTYRFSADDHRTMDIKPDDPTRRVLYRLGISDSENEKDAIEATRRLNPDYPGEFDGILWLIGRTWCHPSNPDCQSCCMTNVCAKRID